MRIEIEVRSSGWGPRVPWGWEYAPDHSALRDGRCLAYWIKAQSVSWPRDGVAVIIRRAA